MDRSSLKLKNKLYIIIIISFLAILIGFASIANLTEPKKTISDTPTNCKGTAACFYGSVTKIVDGDTLNVDGKPIRFSLTSTPERYETGGPEATKFLQTICPIGSQALVDEDDGQTQGSHGRILAVVYCNGMNLNEEILDAGLGNLSTGFCSASEFSNEDWAKKHGC